MDMPSILMSLSKAKPKPITMKRITNLTELEKKVLQCLVDSMYAEWGYSDVGATDISRDAKIEIKVLRGVLSSLVKKSLIEIEDRSDMMDYKANDPSWEPIIYLYGEAQGLVPKWVEESNGQLEPMVIEG